MQCGPDPNCGIDCGVCGDDEECVDAECVVLHDWVVLRSRNAVDASRIDGYASDAVFAASMVGLRRWDGTTWVWAPEQPFASAGYVSAPAADAVWVAGIEATSGQGRIGHYDGADWELWDPGDGAMLDLCASGPDDVWAGYYDRLDHFDGATWESVTFPIDLRQFGIYRGVPSVWASGPADAWVSAENVDGCHLWHWDGTELSLDPWWQPTECVDEIEGSAPDDVWAISESYVLHYDGMAWSEAPLPNSWLRHLHASNGTAWLWGEEHLAYSDGIGGWTQWSEAAATFPVDVNINGELWASGTDDIWISRNAGELGHPDLARRTAGGWYVVTGSTPEALGLQSPFLDSPMYRDLWGASTNDLWVVGNQIVHYDGQSWELVVAESMRLDAVHGAGADAIWAVGGNDIYAYDGVAWTNSIPDADYDLAAVWAVAPDDVWAFGRELGEALIIHWNGVEWQHYAAYQEAGVDLLAAWGLASDQIWLATSDGLMFWDGALWTYVVDTGSTIHDVHVVDDDHIYVARDTSWGYYDAGYVYNALPGLELDSRVHDVWGLSTDEAWGVGIWDTLVHANGGVGELVTPVAPTVLYEGGLEVTHSVFAVDGELWAVGQSGLVMHYE